MNIELYKEYFKRYGFDVDTQAAIFYFDILDEVRSCAREGMNREELLEMIPRINLEYYHFYYEISRFKFEEELRNFLKSRENNTGKQGNKLKISLPKMNVEESLIYFAKQINKFEDKLMESKSQEASTQEKKKVIRIANYA